MSKLPNNKNSLRIIGGQWRGRKLAFPDAQGLRPTPDRVRETLFNWLVPYVGGARCLDLFAGSGALGLEALSRGASEVVLVDSHAEVIKYLNEHVRLLDATARARLVKADARAFLEATTEIKTAPFDIVFLDPPYHSGLLQPCMSLLQNGWLSTAARIYFEANRDEPLPELPKGWSIYREKTAGQVGFYLAQPD
ncbi:MAG: 16S rRNA (guanine(966)-N(2))-methyltransferase RsmD [Gammaproteobacteria bacterium]|nr:16S rRNA (guanine(966)-N(2))-methyltransferase RsmD [Gammaproteobacteria bacterium]